NRNGAEQCVILTQCNSEQGSATADVNNRPGGRVPAAIEVGIGNIADVDERLATNDPLPSDAVGRPKWLRWALPNKGLGAVLRDKPEKFSVVRSELAIGCLAYPRRSFQHRIEHRG